MLRRKVGWALAVALGVMGLMLPSSASASPPSNAFYAWNKPAQFLQGQFGGGAELCVNGRAAVTLHHGVTYGTWTSPVVTLIKPENQLNPSFQTKTPYGTHVELQMRVLLGSSWSGWYELGKWGLHNTSTFTRTSVNDQDDAFGSIGTDTYNAPTGKKASAYQTRVKLVSAGGAQPRLFQLAVQAFTLQHFGTVSTTTVTHQVDLGLTPYSQYLHSGEYPQFGGGGSAWCSPTSVVETMSRWHVGPSVGDLATLPPDAVYDQNKVNAGPDYGLVDYAAVHTFDPAFGITGNWIFSTAYPAEFGLDTSVRQYPSFVPVESLIKQGTPVVIPLIWDNTNTDPTDDLPGAGIPSSTGHLMAIGGFTPPSAQFPYGGVIAYDPATHLGNGDVRRVYDRLALERDWQNANGGIIYVTGPPVA